MKLAAYALVYLGVPVLASKVRSEIAQSVLGILYIFVLIPSGIVKSIDYYRTNSGSSFISRVFNLLFRAPLALFGLICLAGGLSIIIWVLYNVCVKRHEEYTGPGLVTGLGSFGVGVPLVLYGFATLRSVIRRQEEAVVDPVDEIDELDDDEAEPGAPPYGGPATRSGNSGVSEKPPSVS